MFRKKWKDSIAVALNILKSYQTGKLKPLKTGFSHLDDVMLGGLFNQTILVIAGLQGNGKTWYLQQIENNIRRLNPDAKIAILRLNYEMTVFRLFLRMIKQATKLKLTDILFKPFENTIEIDDIIAREQKDGVEHIDEALTPAQFKEEVGAFLEENKHKDSCIVTLDHIALTKYTRGGAKEAVDEVMSICLDFKKEYINSIFIIISQLNRDIEGRTNIGELAPRMSDLYQSSTMSHAADCIIVVDNPYLRGHSKYMIVSRKEHEYLEEFFTSGKGKTASFDTFGTIFYHYLKVRDPDDASLKTLFAERIREKVIDDTEYKEQKKKQIDDF